MIISKTPYRISFFGGGSDYPDWYKKYSGAVLSTTIDKYIYITLRDLPNFFEHKYRIVWSKVETVNSINQIKHNAVRNLLKEFKVKSGLEIHYDGDLPARSGMGSSSCFVVGLAKVLFKYINKNISDKQLADFSINFEQKIMREIVGSQDQTATVYGGFNRINFEKKKKITVKEIKNKKNLQKLNKNLMLIYSGVQRNAPEVAKKYVNTLTKKNKNKIKKLIEHVELGEKILNSGTIDDFGHLLDEAWFYKKEISNNISNTKIDEIYNLAKSCGALGGKLLGAGGGGFLLFYINEINKKNFLSNSDLVEIPFNFSPNGSKIIFEKD